MPECGYQVEIGTACSMAAAPAEQYVLNLSHLYKETSEGGLARMYARRTPNLGS